MGAEITDEEIEAMFNTLDRDESEKLDDKEMKLLLPLLGIDCTEEEIDDRRQKFDTEKDGCFTLEEFKNFVREFPSIDFIARLVECMEVFDDGETGSLDRDTLKEILTTRGNNQLSEEEAENILADMDSNGDGIFQIREIAKKLCEKNPGEQDVQENED